MKIKNEKSTKLGIAVPCRDQVHSLFTYSLVHLIQYNEKNNIRTQLYMLSGSLIADQRHKLAKMCINDKCTHILWLDSDMMFPAHTADQLLSHSLPVVACNYSTRSEPRKSVAYKKIGDWENWLNSGREKAKLSNVEAVGMGCMLVDTNVYQKMDDPYFEVAYDPELKEWIGEDFYFCKKLAMHEYNIVIDNKLSMSISHLGTTAFTNQTLNKYCYELRPNPI